MADRKRPEIDPDELRTTIEYLSSRTDEDFRDALADNIEDPVDVETAAFRDVQLAYRSLAAARFLIDHANTTIALKMADQSKKARVRGSARFRDRVGMERRLLESIVAGDRARNGILTNAPSAQGRALRRLKQLHLDEFQALKREEQEKIDREAAERREQRRAERRAAKGR